MTAPVITGTALAPSCFTVVEADGALDVHRALEVLRGDLAVHIVHDYLRDADCARLTANFWNSPHRQPRYGEGHDGVEGYLVGASHIEKSLSDYLDEVQQSRSAVTALYTGATDPLARLHSRLAAAPVVRSARPARHGGRSAADSKAVCWNGVGTYLLEPHDDLAQLSDPLQADFEIRLRRRVTAANFYPSIAEGSGQIRVWNVMPDGPSRARLGLKHSGFPYPPASLTEHPTLELELRRGDLCLMNGNLVHAVMRGAVDAPPGSRLLITCFMSLDDNGELLWWT